MKTTQTSPNGGGWEWGLKNPTQTKIFLLRLYNLPLGIQPLKGLLKESMKLLFIELYVKKGEWFTFYSKPLFEPTKKGKEEDKRAKKMRQKKAETKEKGGEKGKKTKRQ